VLVGFGSVAHFKFSLDAKWRTPTRHPSQNPSLNAANWSAGTAVKDRCKKFSNASAETSGTTISGAVVVVVSDVLMLRL
jgi:hypothetical protein